MVSLEVTNKIKEDVDRYYKKCKRNELGGTKTFLYDKVSGIEWYYMNLYKGGYITKKDIENGLTDNVWDELLNRIGDVTNELYAEELSEEFSEGNFGEIAKEYEFEYKTELFRLIEDIFMEDRDTIDKVLKRGITEGSYEKEYVKLFGKLHLSVPESVPEFVYVRYLTGYYLYYLMETGQRPYTEVIESFVDDVEWIIKTRTTWIYERTEDYYIYFIIIGQDPRRGSINKIDSRGLNMKDLDKYVRNYVYKSKEINKRIEAVYNEIDYADKIEEFNEDENNPFAVDLSELGKLYLGTLIVKNSIYTRNGRVTRVMEEKIARLLKEKGEVEGERAMLVGERSANVSLQSMGVAIITIKDTMFMVGDRAVIVIKGKEGQRQVVGRVATSNFSVSKLKGFLR